MFKKILIANRGEIALRVIRACRELGIATVAIYSEVDKESLHVKMADEAYCVGPARVLNSYLNIPNIISAAIISKAEAIHPGYGLLAENVAFAEICDSHGIQFIGPSVASMVLMGDKSRARETMEGYGIPIVPGTKIIQNSKEAADFARKCDYPLIIKATSGGGGKGMRVVTNEEELLKCIMTAKAEARTSFDDDRIYLEKYLPRSKHIEFQIVADERGNVIHLGERDCSIQRRNQKLIEEAPSGAVSKKLRKEMGDAAVKGSKLSGYTGVGTIEFLLDLDSGRFYFMEMNTRIQVEHPVTEMVTGIDLVKEQIRIAAGEKLMLSQGDVALYGHSIECRINAEDPEKGFAPSTGVITKLHFPGGPGLRIDSHIYQGSEVSPYYDSLLAKVISFGHDRSEAIARMRRALDEFQIEGVKTTVPFHKRILESVDFRKGEIHTSFVEKSLSQILSGQEVKK
ncbi:MAG: acetyl-CoA carboxylase biotin carboxylase subunit [Candidatus Eremiobacteraeota bacterium]|nr:acetyl-CoA carboxylase biotin carboxylase subunit [Candidatus Eremiobacteraeota bacterium]